MFTDESRPPSRVVPSSNALVHLLHHFGPHTLLSNSACELKWSSYRHNSARFLLKSVCHCCWQISWDSHSIETSIHERPIDRKPWRYVTLMLKWQSEAKSRCNISLLGSCDSLEISWIGPRRRASEVMSNRSNRLQSSPISYESPSGPGLSCPPSCH